MGGRAFVRLALGVVLAASAGLAHADEQRTRQLVDEGLNRFNVGEYDEAAKRFTEAYLLQPLPELLYDLAQIAAKQERREKAIELYRRYQRSLPAAHPQARAIEAKIDDLAAALKTETPSQRATRRLRSGRALFAHGRLDDADEELNGGYALEPQPAFLVALGDVAAKRNNRPTAVAHYRRFLQVAPADDAQRPYAQSVLAALQPPPPPQPVEPPRSKKKLWWIAAPVAAVVIAGVALGIYFGTATDSGASVPMISVSLHK